MTVFVDKLSSGIGARINRVQKKVARKEFEPPDREALEEHYATVLEKALSRLRRKVEARLLEAEGQKQLSLSLLELPDDPSFWSTAKEDFLADIAKADPPVSAARLMNSGAAEAASLGLAVDFDLVNEQALETAARYTDEWWQALEGTTRDGLRQAIQTSIQTGAPLKGLIKDIEPLFGKGRASSIAATETTRLFAEGNRFAYASAGIQIVEWRTVRDSRVDPLCDALNGQRWQLGREEYVPPRHPRCFIDSQVPVFTVRGWKPIGKIEIGDLVLTHRGRFRRVTALSRVSKKVEAVTRLTIRLEGSMVGSTKIVLSTVTDNHPILTSRGWVEAGQLEIGGKVQCLGVPCEDCKVVIPWYQKVCRTCHGQRAARGLWDNPEARARAQRAISDDNRRAYTDGRRNRFEAPKKARQALIERDGRIGANLQDPETRARGVRKRASNPKFVSFIERKLRWLLEEKGLPFEIGTRIRVAGQTAQGFPRYFFPDLLLPEYKRVIEADGVAWHNETDDAERDRLLAEQGYRTLRFKEEEILQDLEGCSQTLDRVLANDNHEYGVVEAEIVKVERWRLRRARTLYNFEVEEDESYVAKGLIVHNCRCRLLPVVDDAPLEHPTDLDWDPVNDAASRRRFKEQGNLYVTEIEQRVGKGTTTRIDQAEAMKADVQKKISARSGLSAKRTNEFIKTWAVTSSDSGIDSLALQHVASVKFGIEPTAFVKNQIETAGKPFSYWDKTVAEATKFLDAVYAETQEMLARWGITELYLGRGMGGPEFKSLDEVTLFTRRRGKYDRNYSETIDFRSNPLSSWSINDRTFSTWDDYVVVGKIPASRIISTPFTGFGFLAEYEFVVAGGLDTVRLFQTPRHVIFSE